MIDINTRYQEFLKGKTQLGGEHGFNVSYEPEWLFGFQQHLVDWATRKGRAAIFADCGLGKTPMQLAWVENVAKATDKRVLILTPLAVSHQTVAEAEKFKVAVERSRDGYFGSQIRAARDPEDEKHVHPLQLDVIDRCLVLWSNPGETVLTPSMGVGSEVYGSVTAGRRGVGIELKPSYYRQAQRNLASIETLGAVQEMALL